MVLHAPGTSVTLAFTVVAASAAFAARAPAAEAVPPPAAVLQVAGPALTPDPPPKIEPPPRSEPPGDEQRMSDGAGPRLTFGRAFTPGLKPGFYGRFETEYFEVRRLSIVGVLLGLEGWGTEGAVDGGGAIPISMFAGVRASPFRGPKAPLLFFSLGAGVDLVVLDRIGRSYGFGLFSPFGVATAGVEVTPGLRLLADGRASYRWHWTSSSDAQYQLGLTVGLNSYLWDGP